MIWTTLRVLREHDACLPRYKHLRDGLPTRFGQDTPIPLLHILCLNGLDDTLWALSAVHPDCDAERKVAARLMAADFADEVRPIYEASHPGDPVIRGTTETARRFARGQATHEELAAAGAAARAAAATAGAAAAGAAAWAARAAAGAAAGAATAGAAQAAAWAARAVDRDADRDDSWVAAGAAARIRQAKIVFEHLSGRRGPFSRRREDVLKFPSLSGL